MTGKGIKLFNSCWVFLILISSIILCNCSGPKSYHGASISSPDGKIQMNVPVTWDETRVLHAEVGDYVTIARKRNDEWYLGSITDWKERELSVPLDFLGSGDYTAEIYADGSDASTNAESVEKSVVTVTSNDTMTFRMAPGGGHAVRFYQGKK